MVTTAEVNDGIVEWFNSRKNKVTMVPTISFFRDAVEEFVDYLYLRQPIGLSLGAAKFVERSGDRRQNSPFHVIFEIQEQYFRINGFWDGSEDWDNAYIVEVFSHDVTVKKFLSPSEISKLASTNEALTN